MNAYLSRFITDDDLTQLDLRHAEINKPGIGDNAVGSFDRIQIDIEDRMVATHASTIEGMKAKARTLRRLIATEKHVGDACPNGADDIGRMTWSLLTDVLGDQAGTVDQPQGMEIRHLFALYDGLRVLHDIALAYVGNHRFENDEGDLNPAGHFMDSLCNLIGRASDHVAELAEASSTADRVQFGMRAEILFRHEISSDGAAAAATLGAEIYGKPGEPA